MNKIKVPCSYQGGKQRLATQIVDILLKDKKIILYSLIYVAAQVQFQLN